MACSLPVRNARPLRRQTSCRVAILVMPGGGPSAPLGGLPAHSRGAEDPLLQFRHLAGSHLRLFVGQVKVAISVASDVEWKMVQLSPSGAGLRLAYFSMVATDQPTGSPAVRGDL